MSRTRTRIKIPGVYDLQSRYYDGPESHEYVVFVNRETTVDEEHPWHAWRSVVENPTSSWVANVVEMGGEFTSTKFVCRLVTDQPVSLKAYPYQGDYLYKYNGPLISKHIPLANLSKDVDVREPLVPGSQVLSLDYKNLPGAWLSADTDGELATLGATLVSKLAPTAPHNNVFTSLGELRNDGLPSVPFWSLIRKNRDLNLSFSSNAGNNESYSQLVGGEHLNYQFGIAPTVSDVKSILNTVKEADKLWRQYKRDSGRIVRRRMDLVPSVSTTKEIIEQPSWAVPYGTQSVHWSSIGPVETTRTITQKRWVSAAYQYFVHPDSLNGMDSWAEKAQLLYGWKPSPSAAYNLTAWSWLLDWFTNTGDVIDNISLYLEDPFLIRWAYIMEHTVTEVSCAQTLVDNEGRTHRFELQFNADIKKRRRINPFHFGVKEEALNGRQLSILAALGLSKGRNPGSM